MMDRADAIETIKYQITEWLEPEEIAELVQKYTPNNEDIYVFKRRSFDFFCRGHFPEEYLKIAEKLAKAAEYNDYHRGDKWIMWDDFHEEFKSANYPLEFVRNMDNFIERIVMANDPLLKKVHWAEEAIRFIREDY